MATAAAAIVAKTRRDIISYFRNAGAISSTTAVNYAPQRRVGECIFDHLRRQDIVLTGKNGGFYVDLAAWDAHSRSRRRLVIAMVAGLLAILGIVVLVTARFS